MTGSIFFCSASEAVDMSDTDSLTADYNDENEDNLGLDDDNVDVDNGNCDKPEMMQARLPKKKYLKAGLFSSNFKEDE